MKPSILSRAVAVVALLAAGASRVGAETTICTVISQLPYTITAQGSYCLDRNLATVITTGAAITINTNFVVLDLNGFKIGGGSAGAGTAAVGIRAINRQNIVVKNGNVRGFKRGISLEDTSGTFTVSQGHVVEDIRADQNTEAGIWVEGRGNSVRNNQVVDTPGIGGITPDRATYGVVARGPGARVINNDATETVGVGAQPGTGLYIDAADGAVIENNRIGNATLGNSNGIYVNSGDDVLVVGNRIATVASGIVFNTATGKYRDNITTGVTTPYSGGTDAGGNN
jgi:hypothetical protein